MVIVLLEFLFEFGFFFEFEFEYIWELFWLSSSLCFLFSFRSLPKDTSCVQVLSLYIFYLCIYWVKFFNKSVCEWWRPLFLWGWDNLFTSSSVCFFDSYLTLWKEGRFEEHPSNYCDFYSMTSSYVYWNCNRVCL